MALTSDQEMQISRELDRASRARLVLENELFHEAIGLIEADTLEKWKASPVRDAEGQLALRLKWQVIQEFKGQFVDAIETGKLAQKTMEQERSFKERARDAVRAFRRP